MALTINAINIIELNNSISTVIAQDQTIDDMSIQLTKVNEELTTIEKQSAFLRSSQTPYVVTATLEPTATGYTNPNWRDAVVIVAEMSVYEPNGDENSDGNWFMRAVNNGPHLFEGQQIVVNKNYIQVDGGRIYLIIGPVYAGYYVDARMVELKFE